MTVSQLPSPDAQSTTLNVGPTAAYLDAVRAYPPVEAGEEATLLKTIHAGRAAALMLEKSRPDRLDHQRRLRDLVEHATAARKRLMEGHLGLVATLAAEHSPGEAELLETIQVGNHGLMRAIDTFNPDDGRPFTSYATASITTAITQS